METNIEDGEGIKEFGSALVRCRVRMETKLVILSIYYARKDKTDSIQTTEIRRYMLFKSFAVFIRD